jgi:hypothetical protein
MPDRKDLQAERPLNKRLATRLLATSDELLRLI